VKPFHTITLVVILIFGAALLLACSASPTPTAVPPTIAPTIAPTTAPTATTAPTSTPASTTGDSGADKIIRDAFAKFSAATAFRMDASADTSPALFDGPPGASPGTDPNKIVLFTIKGEQNDTDQHFTIGGFLASFIGALSGFDEKNPSLEIISVAGKLYWRGILAGETTARWYVLSPEEAANTRFEPKDLVTTVTATEMPPGSFSKTGTESLDNQTCDVYAGNRAAFDAVLSQMTQAALLNGNELDAAAIQKFDFQIVVCPDGAPHRIGYSLEATPKTKPTEEGTFDFAVHLSDLGGAIVIQAPTDAIPFPKDTTNAQPTPEPTASGPAKNFATLEGEWEGKSSSDSPISFTVEKNVITFANLNYAINTGGCSASGAYGTSVEAPITNQAFLFVLTNSDEVKFTFAGKFNSNNEAAGTLSIKGKTFCGDADEQLTWTAKHISSPDTPEATVEPTQEPTVEAAATDAPSVNAAQVVTNVFAALAKKDVDGALVYFDDDVIYNIAGTSGIGASSLKSNMQLAIGAGTTFAASSIQDLGGIVTFKTTVTGIGAGTYSNSSVIVEDGKIVILTIQ